ncbi:hypothetical protein AB0K51_19535 [Kitasatospora sp. NPDC049285]|uniref:hypothetical protein n=1 Tax=Kitasatospora sp. NPDC049285 TaxID=3157096 RepID=UPI00342DCFE7
MRVVRTVFAVVVGAAEGMPLLVHSAGIRDTVPGLGVVLAVSGSVTRLLALPLVAGWLPSWLRAWLRAAPAKASLPLIEPVPPLPPEAT